MNKVVIIPLFALILFSVVSVFAKNQPESAPPNNSETFLLLENGSDREGISPEYPCNETEYDSSPVIRERGDDSMGNRPLALPRIIKRKARKCVVPFSGLEAIKFEKDSLSRSVTTNGFGNLVECRLNSRQLFIHDQNVFDGNPPSIRDGSCGAVSDCRSFRRSEVFVQNVLRSTPAIASCKLNFTTQNIKKITDQLRCRDLVCDITEQRIGRENVTFRWILQRQRYQCDDDGNAPYIRCVKEVCI